MADSPPELVDRQIKDAQSDRSIYDQFVKDDNPRNRHHAEVRRGLEGAKPLDSKVMAEAGLTNFFNFNDRSGEQALSRALQPYWNFTHSSPNAVNISIDFDFQSKGLIEPILQEGVTRYLRKDRKRWIPRSRMLHKQFLRDGPGFLMWQDDEDPMPSTIRNSRIKFSTDTTQDQEGWEIFYIEEDVTVSELWRRTQDKASDDAGWNIPVVKEALIQAARKHRGGNVNTGTNWGEIQDKLVQNDYLRSTEWGNVKTVVRLSQNWDGSVSKKIFTREALADNDGYLYEDEDFSRNWTECLNAIFYDIGNGTIHGTKGFGIRNYAISKAQNIFRSQVLNSASFNMGVVVQRESMTGNEAIIKSKGGFVTEISMGVTPVKDFKSDYADGVGVINMLEGLSDRNNNQFNERSEQIAKAESAEAASQLGQIGAQADQSNASTYLTQMSVIYTEMVRRLFLGKHKLAKNFRDYCRERGVDDEIFNPDNFENIVIESGASATQLNSNIYLQNLKEMSMMGEQKGWNVRPIDEQIISRELGSAMVADILPTTTKTNVTARREAQDENFFMSQGDFREVDPMQDAHVEHMQEHLDYSERGLQSIAQIAQAQQAGQEIPPDLDRNGKGIKVFFFTALKHMEVHMQIIAKNELKKKEFQELTARFNAVQSIVNALPQFRAGPQIA